MYKLTHGTKRKRFPLCSASPLKYWTERKPHRVSSLCFTDLCMSMLCTRLKKHVLCHKKCIDDHEYLEEEKQYFTTWLLK